MLLLKNLVENSHKQNKGIISLCHMSAPEARVSYELDTVQKNQTKKIPIYQLFLEWAIKNKTDGIIVGATFPKIIGFCKEKTKNKLDIYSPGVGVQGGNASQARKLGSNYLIIGDENIGNFYCTQTSISSSDERDKTDITNFTGGLDWIKAMRPVTYKWDKRVWYANAALSEGEELTPEKILAASSDGSLKVDDLQVGFLAQEVLDVEKANGYGASNETSLLVDLTSDETRYGLKYSLIVPILVSAMKEQQTIIDDLKSRIETLEG